MDYIKNMIEKIESAIDFNDKISGKTFLITGATGLIGSALISYLITKDCKVVAVARNIKKAEKTPFYDKVTWIFAQLKDEIVYEKNVDYVIHTASPTSSSFFVEHPVETINDNFLGLNAILRFSLTKKVKSFVYLSSMEAYGLCREDRFIKEDEMFSIDPINVRSSYPEGKKIGECLCVSFGMEYGLPVKIVRLGQTFGAGVDKNDNRAFSQFAKSVVLGQDIVLSTKGLTKRSYCSVIDAVIGIITVLFNGKNNNAYNLASDNSYCSVYEMAQMFAKNTASRVLIAEKVDKKYLPDIQFGLDTSKIKGIGFVSKTSLQETIAELIDYYKNIL